MSLGISNLTAQQASLDALATGIVTQGPYSGDQVSLVFADVDLDGNGNPLAVIGGSVVSIQQADPETGVSTVAFASGTAVQNKSAYRRTFSIATATAGTATIAVGPTSSTSTTLVTSKVTAAVDIIQVSVPPGFWVKVTLATSTGATNWEVF